MIRANEEYRYSSVWVGGIWGGVRFPLGLQLVPHLPRPRQYLTYLTSLSPLPPLSQLISEANVMALTPRLQAAQIPRLKKLIDLAKATAVGGNGTAGGGGGGGGGQPGGGGVGAPPPLTWTSPSLADVSEEGKQALQAAGLEPATALLLVELVGYMGPEDLQVRGRERDGRGEP